jgi:hypothetical protein
MADSVLVHGLLRSGLVSQGGGDGGGVCRGCTCLPARLKSSIRLRVLGVTIIVLVVYITLVCIVLQPPEVR